MASYSDNTEQNSDDDQLAEENTMPVEDMMRRRPHNDVDIETAQEKERLVRTTPVGRTPSGRAVKPGFSFCQLLICGFFCFLIGGVVVFVFDSVVEPLRGGARNYFGDTSNNNKSPSKSDNQVNKPIVNQQSGGNEEQQPKNEFNQNKVENQDNKPKEEIKPKEDNVQKEDNKPQENNMQPLAARRLSISTWNIAAINNNPFEYWITYKENPAYEELMVKIENFLENPGEKDVKVPEVFTQNMFEELDKRLTDTAGWTSVRTYWDQDFSKRNIVSQFMKDPLLGSKRLASMPDRITNTMNTEDGKVFFRPTVINMYEEDLSSQDIWWKSWEKFMFDTSMKIKNRDGVVEDTFPYKLLQQIKKSKYPEITEQEETDSLPLQTLCGAIFDAILVHMMNSLSAPDVWQPLKRTMVENLNKKKVPHTIEILEREYSDHDIITMQEVSSAFIEMARKSNVIGTKFHVISPKELDSVRDQNSVICLNKSTFPAGDQYTEISDLVQAEFGDRKVPVANGDILAITTENKRGEKFVVASFHGDTNGLATIPVMDATVKAMKNPANSGKISPGHKLVFGMDANTYEHATPGKQQDVLEWATAYGEHGLQSCWGEPPNPSNYTTYNARTYLQPQLNKACKQSEKREKGDVNPKDFILFPKDSFKVIHTWKDNTGRKEYIEDMAFPTLEFPSDHGILSTIIEPTN